MLKKTTGYAKEYSKVAKKSVLRNSHMNELKADEDIDQRHIDAVLVDFINYIGMKYCIDYALYSSDLKAQ